MKLYTKTKALKFENGKYKEVLKGQGSNTQINIDIMVGSENPKYKIFINKRDDDSSDIVLVDMEKPFPNEVWSDTIKGKSQKTS